VESEGDDELRRALGEWQFRLRPTLRQRGGNLRFSDLDAVVGLAQFRADVEALLTQEAVEAVTDPGVRLDGGVKRVHMAGA